MVRTTGSTQLWCFWTGHLRLEVVLQPLLHRVIACLAHKPGPPSRAVIRQLRCDGPCAAAAVVAALSTAGRRAIAVRLLRAQLGQLGIRFGQLLLQEGVAGLQRVVGGLHARRACSAGFVVSTDAKSLASSMLGWTSPYIVPRRQAITPISQTSLACDSKAHLQLRQLGGLLLQLLRRPLQVLHLGLLLLPAYCKSGSSQSHGDKQIRAEVISSGVRVPWSHTPATDGGHAQSGSADPRHTPVAQLRQLVHCFLLLRAILPPLPLPASI